MVISAFYSFKVHSKKTCSGVFSIERMLKVGNNGILNFTFENYDSLVFRKLGPIESAGGYTAYFLFGNELIGQNTPIAFEVSGLSKNIGLVRSVEKEDAVLFRSFDDGIIEVYVFVGRYSSSSLLLQMLNDGSFDKSIAEIKGKVGS
jgi:hypothetical protein